MDDHTQRTDRLWTPWRLSYATGNTREDGCIFCNRLERSNDLPDLILHRGDHSFVIMNLYPYNTGHIMVVPNRHAADPSELDSDALAEMGVMLPRLTKALRRAFRCDGFNVGLNIGSIAGAGVAEHLHQHIVPRWQGDANFMPILASTMTIPELIPVTYAKIRAELTRERTTNQDICAIVLDEGDEHVLLRDGRIPEFTVPDGQSVVATIASSLAAGIADVMLTGWAGQPDVHSSPIALSWFAQRNVAEPGDDWAWIPVADLNETAAVAVQRAIHQRAPAATHHYTSVMNTDLDQGHRL